MQIGKKIAKFLKILYNKSNSMGEVVIRLLYFCHQVVRAAEKLALG